MKLATCLLAAAVMQLGIVVSWQPVAASQLGADIVSGGIALVNPPYTLGWGFDILSPASVTHLGFWDNDGNGLVESHDVGLWRADGTLLAQATVSNASSTTIPSSSGLGNWIFEELSNSVNLGVGTYIVAGVSGNDEFQTFVGGISLDSALANFDSGKYQPGGVLAFPSLDEDSDYSLFGANILIAPVPEPSTVALAAFGLLGMGCRRRKRM